MGFNSGFKGLTAAVKIKAPLLSMRPFSQPRHFSWFKDYTIE